MTEELKDIKEWITRGETARAIEQLDQLIIRHPETAASAFYLKGNAYRKTGNWQEALNSYQEAIDRDPESPAAEARRMVMDILNFYNKDMFNQ